MSSCFAAPRRRWPRTPHAVALSFVQSGQAGLREGKQVVALSGSGCWEVAHWLSAPFCAVTNRSKVCRDNVPGAGSLSSLWRPPNSRLGVGCLAPGPSVPLLLPLPRVCWAVAVTWQMAFCRSPFYQSDPIWILRLTLKAKASWGSLMLKFNTIHPGYWRGQAPRQALLTSTDPGENTGFTVGVSNGLPQKKKKMHPLPFTSSSASGKTSGNQKISSCFYKTFIPSSPEVLLRTVLKMKWNFIIAGIILPIFTVCSTGA